MCGKIKGPKLWFQLCPLSMWWFSSGALVNNAWKELGCCYWIQSWEATSESPVFRLYYYCWKSLETVSFGSGFYVFDICRCNYGQKSWKNEVEKVFVTRDGYDWEHLCLRRRIWSTTRQSNRLCRGGYKITQIFVC